MASVADVLTGDWPAGLTVPRRSASVARCWSRVGVMRWPPGSLTESGEG